MGMEIILKFKMICTTYTENSSTTKQKVGEILRHKMFQEIIPQIMKYPLIKQYPLNITFTYYSIKQYPLTNYITMTGWFLDFLKNRVILDLTDEIVAKVSIVSKKSLRHDTEGCTITITK